MTNPAKSPFPETADIETSSDEYAGRFAGAAGQWMLDVQEGLTLNLLKPVGAKTVLDVGGGHGQLVHPLVRDGYQVTVIGSALSCEKRIRDLVLDRKCEFVVGNVIALPFPDQSFDAVIAFRLVTHCDQWPVLIKELCRVARKAVIVDYPTSQSVNAIAPWLFEAKKKVETNTRTWTLFKHAQIREAFEANGYGIQARRGQFFFPMVIHRMLKSRGLSSAMEGVTRAVGLNNLCGSPVILRAVRG
jgi:2-polyprenyl-3-methyl-5-hydroxy-6-metoxy-1,4-benzoquinol methylase